MSFLYIGRNKNKIWDIQMNARLLSRFFRVFCYCRLLLQIAFSSLQMFNKWSFTFCLQTLPISTNSQISRSSVTRMINHNETRKKYRYKFCHTLPFFFYMLVEWAWKTAELKRAVVKMNELMNENVTIYMVVVTLLTSSPGEVNKVWSSTMRYMESIVHSKDFAAV